MKIKLRKRINQCLAVVEAIADKIYLSTDETDEATRRAYIKGKAKLADALKDS